MVPWQAVLTAVSVLLLGVVLAGLAVRGRWRRLRCLPAYIVVTLLAALAALLWPERVHVWTIWLAKESLVRLLGVAVLVELLGCIFARMPSARRTARGAVVAVVSGAGVALAAWRVPGASASAGANPWMLVWVVEILPRLAFVSALLCLVLLAVALRYMVPLDPLHRAVIYGFAPYLTLYALTIGSMTSAGDHALANLANGSAYLLMLSLWAHAAWRREATPVAAPWVAAWLQPWR